MMLSSSILPLSVQWEGSSSSSSSSSSSTTTTTSASYRCAPRRKVSLQIPASSSSSSSPPSFGTHTGEWNEHGCFGAWHGIRAEKPSRKKHGFSDEPAQRSGFSCRAARHGSNKNPPLPAEGSRMHPHLPLSRTSHLVIPFLMKHWKLIIKAWTSTLISVLAMLALISESTRLASSIAEGDLDRGRGACFHAALLLALGSGSKFFQQSFLAEVASNATHDIRRFVFEKVLSNDQSYFESGRGPPSGDIAYRIAREAEDTGDCIYALLEAFIPSMFQLVVVSIRMIISSPILSIVIILVAPAMSFVVASLGEKLRSISREGQNTMANLSSYLNEILHSIFIVKAYSAEGFEVSRFEKLALMDARARLKKKRMKAFIPEAITTLYSAIALVLFSVAAWAMSHGSLSGTDVASFMTSLGLLINPIQAVGKSFNELKQGEPAIEHLFELIIPPNKRTKRLGNMVLKHVRGDVRFSSVTFRYGDALPNTLTGVSFHVQAGRTVALVGPSGGGKTTIAKLLLGLYEPTDGCISIDGYDIKYLDKKNLRQHVTIVPQNVDLFTGTVAENIAYGELACPDNMERIKRSAMLANAHDFIEKLPDGYNTELIWSASQLSGGQRQRLSVARAIYRGSSILILDEATSALDNVSEKLVKDALDGCMAGRTVFVIAHRLETVRRADTIYFLQNGRILEQGTHSSLLALGGHYASLYGAKDAT